MKTLSTEERLDWLQLIRTPSIGPITFHRLIAKYKSAREALDALPDIARRAGRKTLLKAADRRSAEIELEQALERGVRLIASCEPDYPKPLRAAPDHPPLLFVHGHASLFEKPAVAIIGARNASAMGRKIARTLAADLGAAGIVIASGLARGIDGAAHEASLATGTIAVVAGGVDVIYPPEHADLTARIAAEGAVISECPIGATPTARDFPKRNRLISGLSRGVIVVEAAAKSGTLITARFALEQGREIFAVPGSPLDPRCQGANRLIRDGATLVETAQDVLDVLAEQNRGAREHDKDWFDWSAPDIEDEVSEATMHAAKQRILEMLGYTPVHRDEIMRELDFAPGIVADALLDLILSGAAAEHSGGRFTLAVED